MNDNTKTCIILGAGASKHYGLPLGSELIDVIINSAKYRNNMYLGGDYGLFDLFKVRKFVKKLKDYDPISIDSFLTTFSEDEEVVEIGKQLIAHHLLALQNDRYFTRANKANWYKYFYDAFLAEDYSTAIDNDSFRVITFNYDLSLEYFLDRRTSQNPNLSKSEAWAKFCEIEKKIFHVYGSIYDYKNWDDQYAWMASSMMNRYDFLAGYRARAKGSKFGEGKIFHNNIKVIGEERSDQGVDRFTDFKNYLRQADRVFVLGFGFDSQNCKLLEIDKLMKANHSRKFYYTNYGDKRIINDYVSSIFRPNMSVQKSSKTVYEALTDDFAL